MVFKIGDKDYTNNVIMDTYDVNQIDIFTSWEDANGITHRDVYRRKIKGQFDMQISKLSEYQGFINDIQTYSNSGNFLSCVLAVNNLNTENVAADCFIEYTPIRTMNNDYTKGYLSFTVKIEER